MSWIGILPLAFLAILAVPTVIRWVEHELRLYRRARRAVDARDHLFQQGQRDLDAAARVYDAVDRALAAPPRNVRQIRRYCSCDAPDYTETRNLCARCGRPVVVEAIR